MEDQELTPHVEGAAPEPEAARVPRFRIGAAVALAAAAGLAAWFVVDSRDDGSGAGSAPPATASVSTASTTVKPIGPVGLSAQGLRTLIASAGVPVYWAGPETGKLYELTRTTAGKVFVRYLPTGVKVGTKQSTYLIVATYPFRKPYQALEQLQSKKIAIPGGGIAVVDQAHPESVHVAYLGVDVQVEVYDPSPARSLQLARSGAVKPIS